MSPTESQPNTIETAQRFLPLVRPRRLNVSDQLSQLSARVEHAGLHGGGGDADDLRALGDRSLVIVHEVDDLSMLMRQMGQRLPQQLAAVLLLQGSLGSIGRVADGVLDLLRQLSLRPEPRS